jgi:mono/diheme cytochrome c family protein
MRIRRVRLAAFLFALALAMAAAAAASRAGRPTPDSSSAPGAAALDGRALYARSCVRCHAPGELFDDLRVPEQGAAVLDMLDFLDDHGVGNAFEDRALVRYLLEQSR